MSDTPRTDDLARGNHVVPTDFARELEQEIETLQTRHAAVMLHTQAVVNENSKLRVALIELLRWATDSSKPSTLDEDAKWINGCDAAIAQAKAALAQQPSPSVIY